MSATLKVRKFEPPQAPGAPAVSLSVNGFETPAGVVRAVRLIDLRSDPTYQRGIKPHHRKIEKEWNPLLAGLLIVGARPDGHLWCIDGQNRRQAMLNLHVAEWPALVIPSEGVEYEARIYDGINNNRKPLNVRETFRSQIVAGDKVALAAKAAAEAAGYRITYSSNSKGRSDPGELGCLRLLYNSVAKYGAPAVTAALEVIREAWPTDPDATRENMISGMLLFLARFKERVDRERLIGRLRSHTAWAVYSAAANSIHAKKGRPSATARAYAEAYNHGLRKVNKLRFDDEV